MTDDELAAIEARHRMSPNATLRCVADNMVWPCDFAKAAAALRDERAARARVVRKALTASYGTADGESWRLVPMEADGGVMASGIPDGLLDVICDAALAPATSEGAGS